MIKLAGPVKSCETRYVAEPKGAFVKKITLLLVLVAILLVALGGLAYAATPQDIYDDYADNGVLDGAYTDAELQAYLNDATLHQYPQDASKVNGLDALVRGLLSARERFPFTGFEAGFVALGVLALLGVGLGLRRAARAKG